MSVFKAPDIFKASANGDYDRVKQLIMGPNGGSALINQRTTGGYTPLHYACAFHDNMNVVELLINNGADVNASSDDGVTPIMKAILKGIVETVKLLLDAGARTDATDNSGWSVFDYANRIRDANDRKEIMKLLGK